MYVCIQHKFMDSTFFGSLFISIITQYFNMHLMYSWQKRYHVLLWGIYVLLGVLVATESVFEWKNKEQAKVHLWRGRFTGIERSDWWWCMLWYIVLFTTWIVLYCIDSSSILLSFINIHLEHDMVLAIAYIIIAVCIIFIL